MLTKLYVRARTFIESEQGATATEYAVLVGFIAIMLIAGATLLVGGLNGYFGKLGETIADWAVDS